MTRLNHSVRNGIVYPRPAGKSRADTPQAERGTGQLSLPAHMYRAIPEGAAFRAEFHPDGILYRFVGVHPNDGLEVAEAPEWAKP